MIGFLRRILPIGIVILLSFWAVKPFLHPGFFPMHDDTQVARVYEMTQALISGQFPVRWVQDLGYGYGYPIFNFYAPLPYYIGASFNLLGFDLLVATKIMFLFGIILAAITMFLLLKKLVGEVGAMVGSVLYMYAPYHAVDIYVRGAVGELYVFAFLPLILLGILKIVNNKEKSRLKEGIIFGSIGISGVLLSHNILGMITGYILLLGLLIYFIVLIKRKKKLSVICYMLYVICLGFGLSSFFVLPAIFEKDFTRVNELVTASSHFSNHFVYLDQLWSSPWGYAGSAPGRLDGMSFMIGKIHILLGFLSIPIILLFYKRKKITNFQFLPQRFAIYISMLVVFLFSVFLMLEQSKFIWDLLPGFSFIQYPWRFLVFTTLSLSIMISIAFVFLNRLKQIIIGVFLIVLIVGFNSKYFIPKEYLSLTAKDYTDGSNLRFKISKISDEYLPKDFTIPKSAQNISWQGISDTQNLKIIDSKENPTKKIYNVESAYTNNLQTNITYFPGWKLKIDGVNTNIYSKEGRIGFIIPAGKHSIELILRDTPIRLISNIISILSLFLVIYIIVF